MIDPAVEAAMAFAERIAKAKVGANQDREMVEVFATFAGIVAQEDAALAMRCLEIADRWFRSSRRTP